MEYWILIILWSTWCIIHSGMISLTVTDYLKNRFGTYYKYYRLFFNLVAFTTFLPLLVYSKSLKGPVLFRWAGYLTIIQIAFLIIAIFLFIAGGLKYDILEFIGIRQIKTGKSHYTLSESGDIDTEGILSITRHPWYLAAIIFVWVVNREMYAATLIVNIMLTNYLIIGTFLEERKLIIELGDTYIEYRKRVSMLFPTKWILSKLFKAEKQN